MKKTLVALAALAATASFAQSSVTLYGVGDLYLGQIKNGAPGAISQTVLNSGGLSGGRFGLRGSEDLGGGMSAGFQFENGFGVDNGVTSTSNSGVLTGGAAAGSTSALTAAQAAAATAASALTSATPPAIFARQAFISLNGGFGGVRLGRQYSAYDDLRGGTDVMGHTTFSSTVAYGAWERNGNHYTFRVNNQLRYSTPNMSGLTAVVAYGLGENKTATVGADSVVSAHVMYANGPLTAGLAIQNEKNGATPANNLKHTLLAGSYDLGVAKLNAGFNTSKDTDKDTEFQFGAAIPFGATTLSLAYGTSKNKSAAGLVNSKANSLSLQAVYSLSKRTSAYAGLVNASTKSGAGATLSKTNLTAVGLRHTF